MTTNQEKDLASIRILECVRVGENDYGYSFAVGRIRDGDSADRWAGFAIGKMNDGSSMLFFLPGIGEGVSLGIADRDRAIKLTGAIAQAPEHGYGGVARWFVEEHLRGRPENLRCPDCGNIGCEGDCLEIVEDCEAF